MNQVKELKEQNLKLTADLLKANAKLALAKTEIKDLHDDLKSIRSETHAGMILHPTGDVDRGWNNSRNGVVHIIDLYVAGGGLAQVARGRGGGPELLPEDEDASDEKARQSRMLDEVAELVEEGHYVPLEFSQEILDLAIDGYDTDSVINGGEIHRFSDNTMDLISVLVFRRVTGWDKPQTKPVEE